MTTTRNILTGHFRYLEVSDVNSGRRLFSKELVKLSYKAFGQRQVPQMKIVGSNFAVAHQTALNRESGTGSVEIISKKPTHVVIKLSDLYQEPGAGQPVSQLTPGTLVTLVGEEQGWSLVAKDGAKLGFVNRDSLIPLNSHGAGLRRLPPA